MHESVLLHEAIDGLNLKKGGVVIDGTFGEGGHSRLIKERIGKQGKLFAIDADESAFRGKVKIADKEIVANFRDLGELFRKETGTIDAIILDLGWRLDQLHGGRGFSFEKNEPLLMTLKEKPGKEDTTAEDIVNSWQEESIEAILLGFGGERRAKKIARAIVSAREKKYIKTTGDLVEIILSVSKRTGRIHPATKTFQALRMAANDELGSLEKGLEAGISLLKKGGRMSVITFHSGEDRMVKHFFKKCEKDGFLRLIVKKPIIPTKKEIEKNPRSRSAKLRIIEKQ